MKTLCVWTLDDHDGSYDTSCGETWEFTTGTIKDNRVKFCPYCGGRIKEASE